MDVNLHHALSPLVERAYRHWEARRQQAARAEQRAVPTPAPTAFTIALARETGTQGDLVAGEVAKLLGWHAYDHELLDLIAQDMGLRTKLLESMDERQQSWLLETVEGFMSGDNDHAVVTESSFMHHLIRTVLALGAHGECVIVGRGAGFILPIDTTLRVRLVGPPPERAAALARRLGISQADAARKVKDTDRERIDFVQNHFFRDPADPRNYDVVLNASRLPVAQIAELIVEALRRLTLSKVVLT